MSITKTLSNIPNIVQSLEEDAKTITGDIIELFKLLRSLADDITKGGAFGTVEIKDLCSKNMNEFAALKGVRQAQYEDDLEQAKTTHQAMFNFTKTTLRSKSKKN